MKRTEIIIQVFRIYRQYIDKQDILIYYYYKNIILVNQQTRSFNGNIEYIDEVLEDDEAFNLMSDIESDGNVEAKRRRANLRIDAMDKRPKCQPVGAQIDCR